MTATTSHHWNDEIFTMKIISLHRLKPYGTEWSRYMLLSSSVLRR